MSNEEIIKKLKSDKRVLKFMRQYRYQSSVHMVTDVAELVYGFYLEGYNNGVKQHEVEATP